MSENKYLKTSLPTNKDKKYASGFVKNAKRLFYATHSSKITDNCSSFFAICDEVRTPLGFPFLSTATCGCGNEKTDFDICSSNSPDSRNIMPFLSQKVESKNNKTAYTLIEENDKDIQEEIESMIDSEFDSRVEKEAKSRIDFIIKSEFKSKPESESASEFKSRRKRELEPDIKAMVRNELEDAREHISYEEFKEAVKKIEKAPMPKRTNGLLRQVYFPVDDGQYHLMTVMQSSMLVNEVNKALKESGVRKCSDSAQVPRNTCSQLMSKNSQHLCFESLPPERIRKNINSSLKHEYLIPDFDISSLPGVVNGMLESGYDDTLLTIIQEGIKKGKNNWRSKKDRAERKQETVDKFLANYGYSCQPADYEIHHIVPIAQGGADVVENMILLKKSVHDSVTEIHGDVFGWKKNT